jgi:chromosome condensin MukBEF ATPase and DNA-binding subunit MukB
VAEIDLDAAIDELYGVDPDDFTARRNELAKQLRAEGRRAASEQIKELRKPSLAAWAVNQLARTNRREIDLLLDTGHRAREAQRGLLAGEERSGLDQALQTERKALQTLHASAREILRGRGSDPPPALLQKVSQTLRAAAVTDEGREALARGRLTKELEPAGFEAFAGVLPATPPAKKRPPAPRKPSAAELRKRLNAARTRARGLERRLSESEEAADKLRDQLQRLEQSISDLRAEVKEAEKEVAEAERAARPDVS